MRRQQKSVHENDSVEEMLSKLVREQLKEIIGGNTLGFIYFMSMFQESVEEKIDDSRGRIT